MQRNVLAVFLVVFLVLFSLMSKIYANGRHVIPGLGDVPVKAICEEKTGTKHHFIRAKIAGEVSQGLLLSARIGEADSQIPLAKIKELTFLEEKISHDGFLKARLLFDDGRENIYMLKVQENNKVLHLVGHDQGINLKISLPKCKRLEFSPLAEEDTNEENANEENPKK